MANETGKALGSSTVLTFFRDDFLFDMFGDSRTADVHVSVPGDSPDNRSGFQAVHWFNQGNMMAGCPVRLGKSFSKSGARPDQITDLYMDGLLASRAGWVIIGYPIINALAQAINGFTDTRGNSVNLSNVALWAFNLHTANIKRLLAAGKKVLCIAEPGAANLPAGGVEAMHLFNIWYRAWCDQTPGVYWLDFNAALWSPAAGNLVTFRTGVLRPSDPTHYAPLGGYLAGKLFRDWLNRMFPFRPSPAGSDHERYGGTQIAPRNFARNPVFARLTGGGNQSTANLTVTGNIPSDTTVRASATGTTLTITSAPAANGAGNEVFYEFATGANPSQCRIEFAGPSTSFWEVSDVSEMAMEFAYVTNPFGIQVYSNLQWNTGAAGTRDWWAMYGVNTGPTTTEAHRLRLQTDLATTIPGSTAKVYQASLLFADLAANQNIKFGVSQHWWHRRQLPAVA